MAPVINSKAVANAIETIDALNSLFVNQAVMNLGIAPSSVEGAAIMYGLSGKITGRTEAAIANRGEHDSTAQTLFDHYRQHGREQAEAIIRANKFDKRKG